MNDAVNSLERERDALQKRMEVGLIEKKRSEVLAQEIMALGQENAKLRGAIPLLQERASIFKN